MTGRLWVGNAFPLLIPALVYFKHCQCAKKRPMNHRVGSHGCHATAPEGMLNSATASLFQLLNAQVAEAHLERLFAIFDAMYLQSDEA